MVQRLSATPSATIGSYAGDGMPASVGWAVDATRSTNPVVLWNPAKTLLLIISGDDFAAGATDAGALLARIETVGVRTLVDLQGWFSGVLVDLRKATATIFNDRYGLGRIYYHDAGSDGLFFATEAKCLLSALPVTRHFDPRGLGEFIALGCVLQNRTLFTDVRILPPGSIWTVQSDGRVEKQRYFSPVEWEQQAQLEPAEYTAQLAEVFGRATRRMFQSSERVGLSLTGGLDSRAVLAWTDAKPGALPCYTFGGTYRDCADVTIARKLAETCDQPHSTLPIGDDFFAQFDTLAERAVSASDGTMDVSGAVELYVNRLAVAIAPVRLTGNYGSEIIRYNVALRPRRLDGRIYAPDFLPSLDEAVGTYNAERQGHILSFIAFKQMPWHHHGRFALERSVLTPRTPFLDNDLVALAYRAPESLREPPQVMLDLIASGRPALAHVRSDRAYRFEGFAPANKLAHLWQEFTVRAEYAYDYGMPPWLARADHALSGLHLERLFLGRHKFYHFRIWYRDRLRGYVEDQLLNGNRIDAGCFRPEAVKRIATEHLAGTANHTTALTNLLTVQQIQKSLIHG